MSQSQTPGWPTDFKEGAWNTYIYNIIKVKQPALLLVKMIAELETNLKTKPWYKLPKTMGTTTNKVSNIHTSFQKFLDILS